MRRQSAGREQTQFGAQLDSRSRNEFCLRAAQIEKDGYKIMPQQIVQRRSRGFICVNTHPEGCRRNVERQAAAIAAHAKPLRTGLDNVLVIGASTGYGLASRIAAAWGFGAKTLGVCLEREPEGNKTATAGFYNTAAFHDLARRDGLFASSVNADAFSDEAKRGVAEIVRKEMGKLDLMIYSVAAPKRTDPKFGAVHSSVLKPIGASYTNKTVDLDSEKVTEITIPPANEQEIANTVAVMGGEDWKQWIETLAGENLLAENARTLAYSYIGPEMTWPIYRDGTIGAAKKNLEQAAHALDKLLDSRVGGEARIAVNKAIVTQASAAIPVVPLYMSILFRAMKQKGLHEGALEQMWRLFFDFLAEGAMPKFDEAGRIRLDDREMRADVQAEVTALWQNVTTENLRELSDFSAFQHDFRALFGFEVEGVDYSAPVETQLSW